MTIDRTDQCLRDSNSPYVGSVQSTGFGIVMTLSQKMHNMWLKTATIYDGRYETVSVFCKIFREFCAKDVNLRQVNRTQQID